MASRKSKQKPTPRYKKRTTRKNNARSHLSRSVVSLVILLTLVGAAGVTARHLLERKIPPPHLAPISPAITKYEIKPPIKVPVYEIFPKKEAPPALGTNQTLARKIVPDTPPIAPTKKAKQSALPKVAIIIDDIGYDPKIVDLFLSIDVPITFSVLPFSPYQEKVINKVRSNNSEIMLHLPMEPIEYPRVNPGPGALLASMTSRELANQLIDALNTVPDAVGVNNHMGSRLTGDTDRMQRILKILKKRGLFFIDSRTSFKSVSRKVALQYKLPFAQRKIFLDNNTSPQKIKTQFEKLIRYARKHGEAVGIGHPHEETFRVLARELPRLKDQIRFVPASRIVHILG